MASARIDFHSRVSLRAIGAGLMVNFAFMILCEALAGGFRLWRFDLSELPELSGGFWLYSAVAWVASSFAGAYIAALAARAGHPGDGALHGLITWASASVIGYGLSVVALGNIWAENFMEPPSAYLFAIFFGDLFAFAAAWLGGRQGAYTEVKTAQRERELEQRMAA